MNEQMNSSSSLADATLCEACTAFSPGHLHPGALVERLLGHRQGGVPQHKALGPMGRPILRYHLYLLHSYHSKTKLSQ